jgi:hypothetical protein
MQLSREKQYLSTLPVQNLKNSNFLTSKPEKFKYEEQ